MNAETLNASQISIVVYVRGSNKVSTTDSSVTTLRPVADR
jgi:hypothetical protein